MVRYADKKKQKIAVYRKHNTVIHVKNRILQRESGIMVRK